MATIKSLEEKAKAYDEALERAKELLEVGLKDTRDKRVVLSFFPELAESEDEKVRKAILELVRQSSEILEKKNQEQMLAWLEKQSEHDSIEESNFFDDFRNSDVEVDSNEDGLIADTIRCKIEKQGEQKPAEWSEEDEENFARVDYACLKTYGGDSYSSDWLREFLGIHKKWKPSDKQMNALEHYMNTLVCNEHKEILFGLYADLKKLKE